MNASRCLRLAFPLAFFLVPCLQGAPLQDTQPVDSVGLLNSLQKLKESQDTTTRNGRMQALRTVQSAAATPSSAWEFYKKAVMDTKFDGLAKEGAKFRDWKKAEDAKLDDPVFRSAISIHLHYLALTMQRAIDVKLEDLVPALKLHASTVAALPDLPPNANELLNTPVAGGMFSRWLQVDSWVGSAKEWEMVPGNIEGIWDKSILPELRKAKSPEIFEYWDTRIQREGAKATAKRLVFEEERFNTERKPRLLWKRAKEFVILEMPNRGINEMVAIIKAYPGHPDLAAWIEEVRGLLQPPKEATP